MSYFTKSISKKNDFSKTEDVIVQKIKIVDIQPDAKQVRVEFDEDKLKELSDSIKERGIMNPIHVRKLEDSFIILTGERRYRASKLAGLELVPCIVHEEDMSEEDIRALQLIENLQRKNLSGLETARGFNSLKKEGLGQREIARALGVSESLVSQGMAIVKRLPKEWIEEIESAKARFSIKELYAVAKEKNKNKRAASYQKLMDSVGEEIEIVEEAPKPKKVSNGDLTEDQYLTAWEGLKKAVRNDKAILGKYISTKKILDLIDFYEKG